jgi:hypothetical protein
VFVLIGALGCSGPSPREAHEVEIDSDVTTSAAHPVGHADANGLPEIDTSVPGEGGKTYVAGVFSGWFRADGTVVQSRGGDDIFVARLSKEGGVDWVRSVGSIEDERAPRLKLDDGRLTLVAMTKGAVDCGRGDLRTFDTETFFVCTFEEDGTPLGGGAFPTGRP